MTNYFRDMDYYYARDIEILPRKTVKHFEKYILELKNSEGIVLETVEIDGNYDRNKYKNYTERIINSDECLIDLANYNKNRDAESNNRSKIVVSRQEEFKQDLSKYLNISLDDTQRVLNMINFMSVEFVYIDVHIENNYDASTEMEVFYKKIQIMKIISKIMFK